MTRDELHSETSALRIDDPDQTSRHSSLQYANSAFALRGAETVKYCKIYLLYYGYFIYIYACVHIVCIFAFSKFPIKIHSLIIS